VVDRVRRSPPWSAGRPAAVSDGGGRRERTDGRPVPEVGRSEAAAPTSVRAIRDARISLAGACRE